MDLANLPFDVFIFVLRISFIFLLYFFLYQIVRAVTHDLSALNAAPVHNSGYAEAPATLVNDDNPAQFIVVDPGKSGLPVNTVFDLEQVTRIGRRPGNEIVLNDDFVSADHGVVSWENNQWWVRDNGSTNGSFVNGNPLAPGTPVLLHPNDIVTIGRVRFRLSA